MNYSMIEGNVIIPWFFHVHSQSCYSSKHMIEIEKKFLLTDEQTQALLANARELGEKSVTDSYLDTNSYDLTTNDLWFRERNGSFELKAPLKTKSASSTATNRYHELTELDSIRQALKLTTNDTFAVALSNGGIERFMTCFTHRRSYTKQGFQIDVDAVTYQGSQFKYAIAEIELIVDNEAQADEAEHRIIEFAQKFSLTTDQVILGKVAAYLKSEKVDHYEALVGAGIFRN